MDLSIALFWSAPMIGLAVGSFLNVVISRLPRMLEALDATDLNLCWPPSSCPLCGHRLSWWENIPLLSYVVLKGRCRSCHGKISLQYPLLEIATALLTTLCAWRFNENFQLIIAAWIFLWLALPLLVIDWQTMLLPDELTGPLLWIGLMVNTQSLFVPLDQALWGAVCGYLFFWSIFWIFKSLTGKDGLGRGDFKLLAALGAWFGWQALPVLILMASFLGILIWLFLFAFRKIRKEEPMPFGPMLIMAGFIVLFGAPLWTWAVLL